MRFRTSVDNEDTVFYSDLNGFQLIRRRTYSKLPLQANFYPMPTTAMIQDDDRRFTVLSAQPLGVAALKKGLLYLLYYVKCMWWVIRKGGRVSYSYSTGVLPCKPHNILLRYTM